MSVFGGGLGLFTSPETEALQEPLSQADSGLLLPNFLREEKETYEGEVPNVATYDAACAMKQLADTENDQTAAENLLLLKVPASMFDRLIVGSRVSVNFPMSNQTNMKTTSVQAFQGTVTRVLGGVISVKFEDGEEWEYTKKEVDDGTVVGPHYKKYKLFT